MRRYSGFLFIYSPLGGGLYSSVIHTKCIMNAEPNFFFWRESQITCIYGNDFTQPTGLGFSTTTILQPPTLHPTFHQKLNNGLKTSLSNTSPPPSIIPPILPSIPPNISPTLPPPQHYRHLRRPHRNIPLRWPRLNLVGSARLLPAPPPHEPDPSPIHPNLPSPGVPDTRNILCARRGQR